MFERLRSWMTKQFVDTTAAPAIKEPSRKDLMTAEGFVDPSRLFKSWQSYPYNPSWLVTRKGLQVYDQMKRDDQVKAALKFKKDTVLATGWEVVSPGDEEEDWEPTRFVRDAFKGVQDGFHLFLVNALGALDYGHSVHERIYREQDKGVWKGKMVLDRLQSLRPHNLALNTDEFGRFLGVTQFTGAALSGNAGKDNILPPGKLVVYTHQLEFGNHYGISDLESAYRPWWLKDNAYKWLGVTLERFGMPPVFALYDPNSYDPKALDELKKVVKNIQNATFGILPRASKDALEMWSQELGRGSVTLFLQALDRFDQHISRALLVPDLIGMGGAQPAVGSLARSQQHFDSFMRVVLHLQIDLASRVVNGQIIPQLCDLNFPNLDTYPIFHFLPPTDDKKLDIMKAWAELVGGGVVGRVEDDEAHIRKVLGFPDNEQIEIQPLPQKGQPGEKKLAQDDTETGTRRLSEDELTAEMQVFAEETGGEWVELATGEVMCFSPTGGPSKKDWVLIDAKLGKKK